MKISKKMRENLPAELSAKAGGAPKRGIRSKKARSYYHKMIIDDSICNGIIEGKEFENIGIGRSNKRSLKSLMKSGIKIDTAPFGENGMETKKIKAKLPNNWYERMIGAALDCKSEAYVKTMFKLNNFEFKSLILEDEEFNKAYEDFINYSQSAFEKLGVDMARGDIKGNSHAWKFFMANKFGWKDRVEQNVEQNVHAEVKNVKDLNDEELKGKLKEFGLPTTIFEKSD